MLSIETILEQYLDYRVRPIFTTRLVYDNCDCFIMDMDGVRKIESGQDWGNFSNKKIICNWVRGGTLYVKYKDEHYLYDKGVFSYSDSSGDIITLRNGIFAFRNADLTKAYFPVDIHIFDWVKSGVRYYCVGILESGGIGEVLFRVRGIDESSMFNVVILGSDGSEFDFTYADFQCMIKCGLQSILSVRGSSLNGIRLDGLVLDRLTNLGGRNGLIFASDIAVIGRLGDGSIIFWYRGNMVQAYGENLFPCFRPEGGIVFNGAIYDFNIRQCSRLEVFRCLI